MQEDIAKLAQFANKLIKPQIEGMADGQLVNWVQSCVQHIPYITLSPLVWDLFHSLCLHLYKKW